MIFTKVVEIETNTLSINIYIKKLVVNAIKRLREALVLCVQKQAVKRI
jgi:hypothetical protein